MAMKYFQETVQMHDLLSARSHNLVEFSTVPLQTILL